jgi:hypothetical protein
MKNQSLGHDHAYALATVIIDIVGGCLREEERRDAFNEFYKAAMASFEHYEQQADRREQRLRPSLN